MAFFQFLKGPLRFRETVIDNFVFRLHYKVTLTMLIFLSIIVAYQQFFGHPILCSTHDGQNEDLVNAYCYAHSTYSVEEAWTKRVGEEVPYPGVDKHSSDQKRKYHTYYHWISLVLLLQAILFFIPRYFWKNMESGKIKEMIENCKTVKREPHAIQLLADDIITELNYNNGYYRYYLMAEVLNLINVIGQIYLMIFFLGNGSFSINSLHLISSGNDYPLTNEFWMRIFPEVTKCTFHTYAPSGDVRRHDTICLLPINAFNAKIYGFLFVWFFVLAVLSCIAVIYRFLTFISPMVRWAILRRQMRSFNNKLVYNKLIILRIPASDWFLIYLISKNLPYVNFRNLISVIVDRIEYENKHNSEEELV